MTTSIQKPQGDRTARTKKLDRNLFRRVEKWLVEDGNITDPELSREMICKRFKIGRNHFAPFFRAYTGRTWNDYIGDLRIDLACRLMKEHPSETLDSIARSAGITVRQTFVRLFTDRHNTTPSAYRKHLRGEKAK